MRCSWVWATPGTVTAIVDTSSSSLVVAHATSACGRTVARVRGAASTRFPRGVVRRSSGAGARQPPAQGAPLRANPPGARLAAAQVPVKPKDTAVRAGTAWS